MRANDIKNILKRLSRENEDIRQANIRVLRKNIRMIRELNGPYSAPKKTKNIPLKVFNYLNRKQFQINESACNSLEMIADALQANLTGVSKITGKPRITVLLPYDFRPLNCGGAIRAYNLYLNLSRHLPVNLVSVVDPWKEKKRVALGQNFTAYAIPHTKEFVKFKESEEKEVGGELLDILLIDHYDLIPDLVDLCEHLTYNTDIFIASHPFLFRLIKKICENNTLVYEAHNIEAELKKSYFPPGNDRAAYYIEQTLDAEREACRESSLVVTVSKFDADYMVNNFGIKRDKIHISPNCADTRTATFIDHEAKASLKERLGIKGPMVIFLGGRHGPNIEATDFIIEKLAPQNSAYTYVVAGRVCEHYIEEKPLPHIPDNVAILGMITEEEKEALYNISDVAINPMFSGSGTNIKIYDYSSHGLPIVTTRFGMRGIEDLIDYVTVCERDDFIEGISISISKRGSQEERERISECRKIIREKYDYRVIASKLATKLAEISI